MHPSSLHRPISLLLVATLLAGTVLSLLPTPTVQAASPALFAAAVNFATGASPRSIVVGDFNFDGKLDLATANTAISNVSVLLGKSDGTFNAKADYPVGSGPFSLVMGDFNLDGKLDLATANFNSDNMSVLLGTGSGAFQARVDYPAGDGAIAIASGDLNRDGRPDLVTADLNIGRVSVLLGNGTGSFQAPVNYSVGTNPRFVVISDLNADGRLDLVVANEASNNVSVLLGNGNGTFQAQVTYPVAGGPFSIAVGDLNIDGTPDLAVTSQNNSRVNVLLGSGGGIFAAATSYPVGAIPYAVAVGDFNADGKSDLAVANASSGSVSALTGDGSGTFQTAGSYPVGSSPASVSVVDLDQDGKPDLVTANSGSSNVSILRNVSVRCASGTFKTQFDYAAGSGPVFVAVVDLNNDGRVDLATANEDGNSVSVLLGNGAGAFQYNAEYAVGAGPRSIGVGDFNHDNQPDLATANFDSDSVSVLLGKGDGTFHPRVNYPVTGYPYSYNPTSIVVGDFNGDGHPDLATADFGSSIVSVLLGIGDGTFRAKVDYPLSIYPNAVLRPDSITLGDFNHDGKLDLVTANNWANSVSLLLGNGDGTFQTNIDTTIGGNPYSVAAGDFDHDGNADLAVTKVGTKTMSVLLGNGNGAFQPGVDYPVGDGALSVAVGDINGDGNVDLSVGLRIDNSVTVFLGDGSGAFPTRADSRAGEGVYSVALGDFDEDGKLDLTTANIDGGNVTVLLGNGDGSFVTNPTFATGSGPTYAILGDFNIDGKPDLVTANDTGSSLSVLLGDGSGAFPTHVDYAVGSRPSHVAMGDLNNDGKADLVTTNILGSSLSVLLGNGNGTFQPQSEIPFYEPYAIAVGDFNKDGKADLAVASGSYGLLLLFGNGNGTFQPEISYDTGVDSIPVFVATGDFNNDGWLDLVTANYAENTVSVLLSTGGGAFAAFTQYIVGANPRRVIVGDFNQDGKSDLVTTNYGGNTFSVLLGKGDGTFLPQTAYPTGRVTGDIAAGDFNRDGKTDLAVVTNSSLAVFQGDGTGAFSNRMDYPILTGFVGAGDVNIDGMPDLFLGSGGVSIFINQASAVQDIHSQGSGAWSSPATWQCRVPTRFDTVTIDSGDTVSLDTASKVMNLTTAGSLIIGGSNTLEVSGSWTTTGSFTPGGGTVIFNGAGAQTLSGDTTFNNLVVGSHSILTTNSSVSLSGMLTNLGWTSEIRSISGSGVVSFGLGGIALDITNPGTLTSLQVKRRDANYPASPTDLQTGRYWSLTPNNGSAGFTASLTLPVGFIPGASDKACRYTGSGWDCAQTARGASSITRAGITQFSDWTVLRFVSTQTALSVDKPYSTYGEPVKLTASLSANSGVPTGMVTFYAGAELLGSGTLDGSGQATFTTSSIKAGTQDLTARYAGEGVHDASSVTLTGGLVVSKATPTAALNLANAPVTYDGVAHPASVAVLTSSVPGSVMNIRYAGSAAAPANAGDYAITADFVPDDTENYNALTGLSAGTLVIDKALLTVTADSLKKTFGADTPLPPLTYTVTGFVNGEENMDVVSGAPLLTTPAAANSPIGEYPITISQNSDPLKKLAAVNYTFTFVNGKLIITGYNGFLPMIMSHP